VTANVLVEPAHCTFPAYDRTLGPEVAELAELAGFVPDAEQRLALDLIFALGPGGQPLTLECALCVGRQNLKTGVLKMAVLGKLFVLEQRLVTWSAHEFATSAEAFRDLRELIEGCHYLDRRILKFKEGHGDESIELTTGQRVIFKTRTRSGGRGLTGDTVIMDEAMFLQPSHMGSLFPTLSARPEPQVLYGGSAGLAESAVWRALRDRGRAGGDPTLCWLEWCDDLPGACATPQCQHLIGLPDCQLDDEVRWARANPTLGKRITVTFVRGERRALPPAEFGRERLGWWDDPAEESASLLADWLECADPESTAPGRPVLAVDASPGSRSAAIVAIARRPDGLPHVEVVESRPGVEWVAGRCRELRKHDPQEWVLDPSGPAGGLVADLTGAGIEPHLMTAREMGQACEFLASTLTDRGLRHLDDPVLRQAVAGAGRRDVGDGMWALSRKRSDVDICSLVAAAEGLWRLANRPAYDVLNSIHIG
jgi:phage terminase large subunit-like protein